MVTSYTQTKRYKMTDQLNPNTTFEWSEEGKIYKTILTSDRVLTLMIDVAEANGWAYRVYINGHHFRTIGRVWNKISSKIKEVTK
tara:strand:- start:601 stop:855 length:255 start_codon:yes stop_codon:yes gene_type:complete